MELGQETFEDIAPYEQEGHYWLRWEESLEGEVGLGRVMGVKGQSAEEVSGYENVLGKKIRWLVFVLIPSLED